MRPPRALVLSSLGPGTGCALRARYLARALEGLGWEVRLAGPSWGPWPLNGEQIPALPGLIWASLGRYDLAIGMKPYPGAWLGLAPARLRGAFCVVDCDDLDGGDRGPLLAAFVRLVQSPATLFAQAAATHHPRLKRALEARVGPGRVLDLGQGVDLERFNPALHPRAAARRRWGLSPGQVALAFTAHLNIACRLPKLIGLLEPWLRQHPKALLLVAGSGPWENRFRKLASPLGSQVRFLGSLSPEDCAAVLAASDCLVTAYDDSAADRHRVPMKVGEALSMGRPVVSTPLDGLRPLAAFVHFAEPEPKAYGAALDRALRTGKARALRGQAWVRRELDWTRIASRFLAQVRRQRALPFGDQEAACPQP